MAYRDAMHELQSRVDELEKEVKRLRTRGLKRTYECPECDGTKVAHVYPVLDQSNEGRGEKALVQPSFWRSRKEGELEAFVCRDCGRVEWYARSPNLIESHERYVTFYMGPK